MKNIFLDTNIMLDLIFARNPFFNSVNSIFKLAEAGEFKLYASAISLTTIYYLVKKEYDAPKAKQETELLLKIIKWTEVNEAVLISAHTSEFNDFEDAVQYFSALRVKDIHSIISRNKKDFKHSAIPVFSPDEFLTKYFAN